MLHAYHHHPRRPIAIVDSARDPSGTSRLRGRMRAEADRRWQILARTLRQAFCERDLLGLRGINMLPHGDKTDGFGQWVREEIRQKVFGIDGRWLKPYVRAATESAQERATKLAPGGGADPRRIATMEALAVSELQGICDAAAQQLTRVVTHCLMASSSPTRTANAASGVIRTMRNRTRAMSDYIVAKTHATTTLSAFRRAGVTTVGIKPERVRIRQGKHGKALADKDEPTPRMIAAAEAAEEKLQALGEVDVITAGDDAVCIVCQEISDDGPYDIDAAENLIPAHPRCRCAFVPTEDERFASVHDSQPESR